MKKLMVLFLGMFMLGSVANLTVDKNVSFNLDLVSTAYAQEAEAPAEEAKVEIEDRDISIATASDLEDGKLEIPAWVGSVILFAESIPTVGPYITKALGYMGILAAVLTFLASLLMGLSGLLVMLGAEKAGSPKWLKDAKKWVDYGVELAKYLSMFNKQKK